MAGRRLLGTDESPSEPDPEAIRALVAPSGANLAGFMPRLAW